MYESMTYEVILRKMLDKIPDAIDKREGSIIYDALAGAAVEITNMYIECDVILNETYADTASRPYLIRRAAERGFKPNPATNSVFRAEFNMDVPIGSRFSLDQFNYVVTEKMNDMVFRAMCEEAGAEPNAYFGRLIPIDHINGLTRADLVELLIPGEDEEDTETFRKRYLEYLTPKSFAGNEADYKQNVYDIQGVGGVKVYRGVQWNGGGTVKLVVINSEFDQPSEELIDLVQTTIDPIVNSGAGIGLAPIGHYVSVVGANYQMVNIETNIVLMDTWTWERSKPLIEGAIDAYFATLNINWPNSSNIIVRISHIETYILDLECVVDIANTKINGLENNLKADKDSIVKRGEVIATY